MADAPVAAPPAINPMLMHGNAMSHLDLANANSGTVDPTQQFGLPALPANFDFAGLDQARANDKGNAAAPAQPAAAPQPAAQPQSTPAQASAQAKEPESALQWNNKRASDQRKESQANYRKSLEQKVAEMTAQLESLKSGQPISSPQTSPASSPTPAAGQTPPSPAAAPPANDFTKSPEYQKIVQERDEYLDIVKQVAVERDPEFKAKFDSARDAAIKSAKRFAGQAAEDVAKILNISDPEARHAQLAERIKDFSEATKQSIMAAAGKLNAIDVERGIELETRKQTFEMRQKQMALTAQQEQVRREQSLRQELDKAISRWRDPENGMPFTLGPNADHVLARANDILFGKNENYTLADLANDSIKAAALDDVLKFAQAQAQQIEKYENLLQRYRISVPDDGGAVTAPVGNPPPAQINDVHGFMVQQANSWTAELEAARQADLARGYGR